MKPGSPHNDPPRFQFDLRIMLTAFFALAMIFAIAGYAYRKYRRSFVTHVPVSGIVLLDGKPLVGALVVFRSTAFTGASAFGAVQDDGRFELNSTMDGTVRFADWIIDGAEPGSYVVTINSLSWESGRWQLGEFHEESLVVPREYSRRETSPLRATVRRDSANRFSFDIRSAAAASGKN